MANKVVFRPILPSNPKYFETLETELLSELATTMMGSVAKTLKQAEEDYIDNWEHKPKIVSEFTHQKTQLKLVVKPSGTNKRYWVFVSRGTSEKVYGPKRAPVMTVRLGYVPKTAPGGVFRGPGSYSGEVVYTTMVGAKKPWKIKARHFEENIVDKFERNIFLFMGFAVQKVLARHR
jgi:hypothetical protein